MRVRIRLPGNRGSTAAPRSVHLPEAALMPHIEKRAAHGLIRVSRALLAGIAGICAILVPSVAWSKVDTCTVAAQTHAFGAYDTINPTTTTSSITVTCTTC